MGWLWFLFLIFAVFSNLMEKAAKMQRQRPSDLPRKEQGGGSPAPRPVAFPPFFWEEEGEEAKPVPVQEGKAELETAGPSTPEKTGYRPAQPVEMRRRTGDAESDRFSSDDFAFQEMTGFSETLKQEARQPAVPSEQENFLEGKEYDEFVSAIVLAQVLARPDFKTVPWQRKL